MANIVFSKIQFSSVMQVSQTEQPGSKISSAVFRPLAKPGTCFHQHGVVLGLSSRGGYPGFLFEKVSICTSVNIADVVSREGLENGKVSKFYINSVFLQPLLFFSKFCERSVPKQTQPQSVLLSPGLLSTD